jgi:hypothetical protein
MYFVLVGAVRLELTTYRLKADYSAIELRTLILPHLSLSMTGLLYLKDLSITYNKPITKTKTITAPFVVLL